MKCVLQRKVSAADWMFGDWFIEGEWQCHTLEDELRELKVDKETAIGAGLYELVLEDSPKFGPDTITFVGVNNFKYIRVHGGTSDDDTEGCVIVGDKVDEDLGKISGAKVRGVLEALKLKLIEAIDRGERVWIEVRNAPGAKYVDTGATVAEVA